MKLVVFDIDGTLLQSAVVENRCFVRSLAEVAGLSGIDTDWARYDHATDSGIVRQIYLERLAREPSNGEYTQLERHFTRLLAEAYDADESAIQVAPGAASALLRVREQTDWCPAIATGGWRAPSMLKLQRAGLNVTDIPIAFSEYQIAREEVLRAAIGAAERQYGCAGFSRVVSVGDGIWDIRAAHNLSVRFLGVGHGPRADRLRASGATRIVRDFGFFDGFVQALQEATIPLLPDPAGA